MGSQSLSDKRPINYKGQVYFIAFLVLNVFVTKKVNPVILIFYVLLPLKT